MSDLRCSKKHGCCGGWHDQECPVNPSPPAADSPKGYRCPLHGWHIVAGCAQCVPPGRRADSPKGEARWLARKLVHEWIERNRMPWCADHEVLGWSHGIHCEEMRDIFAKAIAIARAAGEAEGMRDMYKALGPLLTDEGCSCDDDSQCFATRIEAACLDAIAARNRGGETLDSRCKCPASRDEPCDWCRGNADGEAVMSSKLRNR